MCILIVVIGLWLNSASQGEYLRLEPGPNPTVTFADPLEQTQGTYKFATVRAVERSVFGYIYDTLVGRDVVSGRKQNRAESIAAGTAEMRASQQSAYLLARTISERASGVAPTVSDSIRGLTITLVEPGSPAARAGLAVGDVLVSVDRTPLDDPQQLYDTLAPLRAQDVVDFEVERNRMVRNVKVTVETSDGKGFVGVRIVARDTPVAADAPIVTDGADGPSAGLVFALAYLDLLTGSDVSGGLTVAGSGTISADGRVGSVSGVELKARGLSRGVDVFLVPAGAVAHASGSVRSEVDVVGVMSIVDALAALCERGSSAACDLVGPARAVTR